MQNRSVSKSVWRIMGGPAFLLFLSFLAYSYMGVYTARILGAFVDDILNNELAAASTMLLYLGVALGVNVIVLPALELAGNIASFKGILKYDRLVADAFFSKRYADMRGFETGHAFERVNSDPPNHIASSVFGPVRFLSYATAIVMICVSMISISLELSLAAFVLIFISLSTNAFFLKKLSACMEDEKLYKESFRSFLIDILDNRMMLRSFGANRSIINGFRERFERYYANTYTRSANLTYSNAFIGEFVMVVCILIFLTASLLGENPYHLTPGLIITCVMYMMQIKSLVGQCIRLGKDFSQIPRNAERVDALTSNVEIPSGIAAPDTWGSIGARSISFGYKAEQKVIDNLDFEIRQNTLVHLMGDNGAGKTTLLNILCGLYRVSSGEISLAGRPLDAYDIASWREKISVMDQFPDLFPGTVFENVRIAGPAAPREKVKRVLDHVGIGAISDKVLSGDRNELSGGELRRVSLARLLIRETPIHILDEPYDNIDDDGKELIDRVLGEERTTRIYVSHGRSSGFMEEGSILLNGKTDGD